MLVAQHKISGTCDDGSKYYIARVAILNRDPHHQISTSAAAAQLSIDIWYRRQSTLNGKLESERKSFLVNRAGHYRYSRLTKEVSRWLDSQETPLDAKVDTLVLVRTCYESSRRFKLLKRLTLTLEIGVTALEDQTEEGGGVVDGKECVVCLEGFSVGPHSRPVEIEPCSHAFHGHCIAGWLKKQSTCPLCRTQIEKGQIEDVHRLVGITRIRPAIVYALN